MMDALLHRKSLEDDVSVMDTRTMFQTFISERLQKIPAPASPCVIVIDGCDAITNARVRNAKGVWGAVLFVIAHVFVSVRMPSVLICQHHWLGRWLICVACISIIIIHV